MFHYAKWEGTTPRSEHFDDIYFSTDDGLEESDYVFLKHNRLPERFQALTKGCFTVAELGFGAGLNFLNTVTCFLQHSDRATNLDYFSFERYPLRAEDVQAALQPWHRQLGHLLPPLLAQYTLLTPGLNVLQLADGRIKLFLFIEDATEGLTQISPFQGVDAWFFDGFSPDKNPQMWQQTLFTQVAALCKPDATFSTFTSAGWVRNNLENAGFSVHKAEGFRKKREISYGCLNKNIASAEAKQKPWLEAPKSSYPEEVIVIGAGISGAATAWALAQKGIKVTVLEQEERAATGASGNRQGILYTKLSPHLTAQTQLLIAGYAYTLRLLRQLMPDRKTWQDCGIIHFDFSEKEQLCHEKLAALNYPHLFKKINVEEATTLSGLPCQQGGLYFPQGGWINPPSVVNALLAHPNIRLLTRHKVTEIAYQEKLWHITCDNLSSLSASHVVICQGYLSDQLLPLQQLPLTSIRGQVTHVEATTASKRLKCALNAESYISPEWENQHCFGATFVPNEIEADLRELEQQENIQDLAQLLPSLMDSLQLSEDQALKGKAGIRCDSVDHLPLVGGVADYARFIQTYQELALDKNRQIQSPCPYLPNLYINVAHGTKGLSTAPIAGLLLAQLMTGEALPVSKALVNALNPNRFWIKQIIQRKFL